MFRTHLAVDLGLDERLQPADLLVELRWPLAQFAYGVERDVHRAQSVHFSSPSQKYVS